MRTQEQMNNKQIVKNRVLVRKISEYFQKHPEKDSVVLNANLGESKLFWKAVREGHNKFKITEVNTSTSNFMFEVRTPLRETSAPFGDISKSFMDTVSNRPDPKDIQNTIRVLNAKAVMLQDPAERDRAGNMIASLTALASAGRLNSKMKTGPSATSSNTAPGSMPGTSGTPPSPFKREASIHEAPQASFAFTAASAAFMKAIQPPPDHNRLNTGFKTINQLLTKISDPSEKAQVGSMIGTLTQMVDATTAGAGASAQKGKAAAGPSAAKGPFYKESRLYEASQAFAKASQEFMHGMTPPFDHVRLSQALKTCNQLLAQVTDQNERSQLGMLIGTLTNQVDATTAGGGSAVNTPMTKTSVPAAKPATPPTFQGAPPPAPKQTLKQGAVHRGKLVSEKKKNPKIIKVLL